MYRQNLTVVAFATIDWHDFVVVETIEFVEADDRAVLPVPLVLSELESMTLAERKNLLQFENPKFVADNPQDMEVIHVLKERLIWKYQMKKNPILHQLALYNLTIFQKVKPY